MKSEIAACKSKLDKAELDVSPLQEELQAECMKNKALSKFPFSFKFKISF